MSTLEIIHFPDAVNGKPWSVFRGSDGKLVASYVNEIDAYVFAFGYLNSTIAGMDETYTEVCKQLDKLKRLTKAR